MSFPAGGLMHAIETEDLSPPTAFKLIGVLRLRIGFAKRSRCCAQDDSLIRSDDAADLPLGWLGILLLAFDYVQILQA
jgi:hypothetical protein